MLIHTALLRMMVKAVKYNNNKLMEVDNKQSPVAFYMITRMTGLSATEVH